MKWDIEGVVINKKLFPCSPGTSKHTVTGSIVDFETNIETDIDTMEVTIPYDADNSFSSLTVEHTGANIWGGDTLLQDFINANITNFTYDTTLKTLRYGAPQISGKVIKTLPFKENTVYTFIVTAENSNNTMHTNLIFRYTDGTYKTIQAPQAIQDTKTTFVVTSANNKTIKSIEGANYSGNCTLYYDECGIFEGVLTAQDFVTFTGDPHTLDLGSTVYGGTFDILGGTGKAYDSEGVLQDITFTPVESIVTFNGINNIWCDVAGSTNKVIYLTEEGVTCDIAKQFLPLFYNKERRIL